MREKPHQDFLHTVLAADLDATLKRDPCALVFAVPSLHLLVLACLNFLLENLSAATLVHTGDLENLCGIEPTVGLATHDHDLVDLHFVDIDS